jgi:antitoxin component of MazEF toxin-antitoxin module
MPEVVSLVTKIAKWGKSQGLRFSKELLTEIDLRVGDEVEVRVSEGSLIVTPLTRGRARLDLEQLVQKIPEGYQAEEIDWGTRTGREEW